MIDILSMMPEELAGMHRDELEEVWQACYDLHDHYAGIDDKDWTDDDALEFGHVMDIWDDVKSYLGWD